MARTPRHMDGKLGRGESLRRTSYKGWHHPVYDRPGLQSRKAPGRTGWNSRLRPAAQCRATNDRRMLCWLAWEPLAASWLRYWPKLACASSGLKPDPGEARRVLFLTSLALPIIVALTWDPSSSPKYLAGDTLKKNPRRKLP